MSGETVASLETRDLSIRFGGHVAVDQVSCRFLPGVLTAIVGPNGAGKTTYFNLISGQLRASSGSILVRGRDVTQASVAERAQAGLGRAFQLTQLFPSLSAFENVRVAVQARREPGMSLWAPWQQLESTSERALELLECVGMLKQAGLAVGTLSHGNQRKLEVALLMALDPAVYMFDEPTAGMSEDDVPIVLDLIAQLKQEVGKTILLVEHKMDVLEQLADRIVVLIQGRLVADGLSADVMNSDVVQQAYLGVPATKATVA